MTTIELAELSLETELNPDDVEDIAKALLEANTIFGYILHNGPWVCPASYSAAVRDLSEAVAEWRYKHGSNE